MIVRSLAVAGVLGSTVLFSGLSHATNGYFSHGYGVRAQGVAGIGIALPQDSLAAASNPAGTALVGDRLDFGLTWFSPDRSAEISGSPVPGANGHYSANEKSDFFIPEFGYTRKLNDTTSIGLAVYANGGMNTDYGRNPYGAFIGANGQTGINFEQLFIAPSLAWKVNEQHAIGAALNVVYQRFEAKGLSNFAPFSAHPANLSDQGKDSATGVGLHLGWTGRITPELTLGARWASKIHTEKFEKYAGLFADGGNFDVPENYGIGLSYAISPALTVALEAEEIRYGDIKSIANPIASLAPGNLGSANGAGFGWKDVNVTRLGVVYAYRTDLTLRAGYDHSDLAIPASQTFFNILAPAVVQDHLTLGATWKVSTGGELSIAYAHAFSHSVKGSGSLAGFGGGEVNLKMQQDSLGIAYGWSL